MSVVQGLVTSESLDDLMAEYRAAVQAATFILVIGPTCACQVLTALRGVVSAEVALLRAIGRSEDQPTVDALTWELQRLERESNEREASHHPHFN